MLLPPLSVRAVCTCVCFRMHACIHVFVSDVHTYTYTYSNHTCIMSACVRAWRACTLHTHHCITAHRRPAARARRCAARAPRARCLQSTSSRCQTWNRKKERELLRQRWLRRWSTRCRNCALDCIDAMAASLCVCVCVCARARRCVCVLLMTSARSIFLSLCLSIHPFTHLSIPPMEHD